MDYADTITAEDTDLELNDSVVVVNESYVDGNGFATSDKKIYTEKVKEKKRPKKKEKKRDARKTITMTGRPSCSACAYHHRAYKWSTHTYLDYCPNCHHYNCLYDAHKSGSVHEKEISCRICDSDFCIRCGKEKYSWSKVHLLKS